MKKALVSAIAIIAGCAGSWAADDTALYDSAQQALSRGILPVGIAQLQQFLATQPSKPMERAAALDLAEALLDSGDTEGALQVAAGRNGPGAGIILAKIALKESRWQDAADLTEHIPSLNAQRIRAEALIAMGRIGEAQQVLNAMVPDPKATLRLAELELGRKNYSGAEDLLKKLPELPEAEAQWENYLTARLALARGKLPEAQLAFEDMLRTGRHLTESLLAGAALGLADVRIKLNGAETADNVIEDFISQNPDSRYLGEMFERLDQIYDAEESPSEALLEKWLRDRVGARTAYAEFYMAKQELREKRPDRTIRRLGSFVQDYSTHPLYPRAQLLRGNLLMKSGDYANALSAFEEAMRRSPDEDFRAEAEIATGTLQFQQKEYVLAVNTFHSAAQHSAKYWEQAIYNSALAWLYQGNYAKFLDDYQGLRERYPNSPWLAGLLLEKGLLQARSGDENGARDSLRDFRKQFPDHYRLSEADLAMAELAFLHDPPKTRDASQYLKVANENSKTPQEQERADYLAFFLADASQNDSAEAVASGRKFLREHLQSAHVPDVEMKLGQIFYRTGDFAAAQNQFETLVRDFPNSELVESALFMAGQAAMQTMSADGMNRGLELFEQTIKVGGPLKLYARQQQAIAQMRAGKFAEAQALYDDILSATPAPDRSLQSAAMLGKADALFAQGAADPKHFAEALDVFSKLAAQADGGVEVRNEANYKKGKCLEKIGKTDEAVAAFYDVVQAQLTSSSDTPEYFWSYKAGFEAGQLLEDKKQWQSAIGIYTMLGDLAGPRSNEAKNRANDIRLEHFVWD